MAHIQKRTYTSRRTGKAATAWQARYTGPDGKERTQRFQRKVDAQAWLDTVTSDITQRRWVDPKAGEIPFRQYSREWLDSGDLRATTSSKYTHLLECHILPEFGELALVDIEPLAVRAWYRNLARRHPATAAGAYRLLATIFNTAIVERRVAATPCTEKGAAQERSPERPIATVAEISMAIDACVRRFRLAVLLAVWCHLRRGEVLGLLRQDLDLGGGILNVGRALCVLHNGTLILGPPKTEAGIRPIEIPPNVIPALREHLDSFVGPGPEAWVFPGEGGDPAHPRTLNRAWATARKAIGRNDLRFHDLRHTGLTLAASTGATTAELMHRGGHASPAAALRYQHASAARDRAIANALGDLASGKVVQMGRTNDGRSSTNDPPGDTAEPSDQGDQWQPQRDSNPCLHLERVVS